jgi:hypothetical protein
MLNNKFKKKIINKQNIINSKIKILSYNNDIIYNYLFEILIFISIYNVDVLIIIIYTFVNKLILFFRNNI